MNFETLWNNFPDKEQIKTQCTNKQKDSNKPFEDYCAIMLSECFIRSGIDLSLITGKRCWSHSGTKHILLAEEFANGLKKNPPKGFGNAIKVPPNSFKNDLAGKTGVIFFKDYWQRGKETFENRSGDHIDLWNKSKITGSSMMYRSLIEFFGIVSELSKSKEIWFWEVSEK